MVLRCPICVDFLEREENRNTRRKTLEAQERSTAGTLSHETSTTRLGFSGERHNALTARATRTSLNRTTSGTVVNNIETK